MTKKKIFIACDTDNIDRVKKIIKETQTKKLKIGYKFGLEFFNSKKGRVNEKTFEKCLYIGDNVPFGHKK